MHIIEIKNLKEAYLEFEAVGPDKTGAKIMAPKAVFRIIKIKNLSPVAINILKQDLLSLGGEAVCRRGVITHSSKSSDILAMGTLKQLNALAKKLRRHQFGLAETAKEIETVLSNCDNIPELKIGNKNFKIGKRTFIMGILNVTPDSFFDGGKYYSFDRALSQGYRMIDEGADIIDVGGESARPGSFKVSAKEEISRIVPAVKMLSKKILVSVDTYKSETAEAALSAGAAMVNDISGLRFDRKMAEVIKKHSASAVLMHIRGTPRNMQKNPQYRDLLSEVIEYLKKGLAIAENAGILNDRIVVDPGFGFGKTPGHNLELIKRLREIKSLGRPVLIGTSQKSTIGAVLNCQTEERLLGTAATVAAAIVSGADFVRVHDVAAIKQVVMMTDAITRR